MASKFKVKLAIFGVRLCNQKGLTGQLGSIHGKFSTDWRAAQSEFTSLPLEKQGMVVHSTKPFAFRLIRQVERTVSHEQDVYLGTSRPAPFFVELKSSLIIIRLDVTSAIKN